MTPDVAASYAMCGHTERSDVIPKLPWVQIDIMEHFGSSETATGQSGHIVQAPVATAL